MRTTIASATFLLLGAGAATIGAKSGINMLGSDTLRDWTVGTINGIPAIGALPAVAACPNLAGITYGGTGSTNGLNKMKDGTQEAAPMSSRVNSAGACTSLTGGGLPTNGAEAEGIITALDGLSVTVRGTDAPSASCGGIGYNQTGAIAKFKVATDCTALGCVSDGAGQWDYSAGDEKDFLRLLYFGIHNHINTGTRNCASDVRKALVSAYKNLFHNPGCSGTCNGKKLKHAYRRDDGSGTTDVFIASIGVDSALYSANKLAYKTGSPPGQQSNPFCNAGDVNALFKTVTGINLGFDGSVDPPTGPNWNTILGDSDFADLDPIRTTCEIGDDVCAGNGTNGLVQVVFPPDLDPGLNYPPDVCDEGSLELPAGSAPYIGYFGTCGDGAPSPLGRCVIGYKTCTPSTPCKLPAGMADKTSGISHLCIQQSFGVPGACWILAPQGGKECRGANNWMRNVNGTLVEESSTPVGARPTLGGWFRKHMNFKADGSPIGAAACKFASATANIGCLVGSGENCSVGYAGREATEGAGNVAEAATIKGIAPSKANVQALILGGTTYPLARKLYYNTIIGFGSSFNITGDATGNGVSGGELELGYCLSDRLYRPYIEAKYGFVEMPESTSVSGLFARCEDVIEAASPANGSCPTTGGVDACLNNNNAGVALQCVGGANNGLACSTNADCPSGVCSGSQCAGTSTYCDPTPASTSAGGVNNAQCGGSALCRNRRIPRAAAL